MHMLCKVRSENGYGFLRLGLKTGVEDGIFGLKLGLDLEMRAAHPVPPPKIPRSTPPPRRPSSLSLIRKRKNICKPTVARTEGQGS